MHSDKWLSRYGLPKHFDVEITNWKLHTKQHRSFTKRTYREVRWPSGRAPDSRARGRGFDPHSGRRVVSLSKMRLPPESTGNTQEAVAPSRHD